MKIRINYKRVKDIESVDSLKNEAESGRPLTLIFFLFLVVSCLAWTFTTYLAATLEKDSNDSGPIATQELCRDIPDELRFDCHPDDNVNQDSCESRGCCWNPPKGFETHLPLDIPYCYYPSRFSLYRHVGSNRTSHEETHHFSQTNSSGFPRDISKVKVEVTCFDKTILRVKIVDANNKRFEVLFTNFAGDPQALEDCDLQFKLSDAKDLRFQIQRKSNGDILFDTFNAGALLFSDQLLQISSTLQSKFIYGLGEHRKPFLKDVNWKQLSFWAADQWPSDTSTNLYGSHPFFLNMDPKSSTGYGMLWLNSNAMEAVLQPTPAITLRSLGGIFDLFFISGPQPAEIVAQYTKIVGKTFLPPYWSLGYHQCKFDYGSLERTKQVLRQTQKAGIPIDVQWNDIDYMDDRKDFTFNKEKFTKLPQFVEELHAEGLHYIPIIDPGISSTEKAGSYKPYDLGIEMDIFIKNSSGHPFNGRVWTNGQTVWPDFTHPKAQEYWLEMFQDYHDQVAFDGAWIDMNEPSNFYDGQAHGCAKDSLNQPLYVPRSVDGGKIFHKTVCPSAKQHLGLHYNLHNLYGYSEGIATNLALTAVRHKRPFIISRSTFPGYGHFGGHWTGDVLSDWSSLHDSITGVLNFNLFGIPMVGADICGFNGNTTAKLCQRWMELGAFYPFARNHNTDNGIDQDPVSLGPEVVEASKEALNIRYSLLPFLYTLFVKAHLFGEPVVTPTFFHAMQGDQIPYYLDSQMFWGSHLLIVPVLEVNASKVDAYLPANEHWYDFRAKTRLQVDAPDFVTLNAPEDIIPLLVRGGCILPSQALGLAKTTAQSQKLPLHLQIFMDRDQSAVGELYWDDGDSLETYESGAFTHLRFHAKKNVLLSSVLEHKSLLPLPNLQEVSIIGLDCDSIKSVTVNGNKVSSFTFHSQLLMIVNLNVNLSKSLKIIWK